MSGLPPRLADDEFVARYRDADWFGAWSVSDSTLTGEYRAPSFAAAGRLVAAIADIADELHHHPDVALRFPGIVTLSVSTHDVGGLSEYDAELAARVAAAAVAL